MKPTVKQPSSKAGFADLYLERYGSGSVQGLPGPDPDLFLIVAIPAYKEPGLAASILSLLACDSPGVRWEIIININYPENSGPEIIRISLESLAAIEEISKKLDRQDVAIHCLWNPDMPARHAGVGLARKIAMDTAIQRFNLIGRKEGIILAFDADSQCEPGYLKKITEFYLSHPSARTANIYFEHPTGGPLDKRIYQSIIQYELYLRYMKLAIESSGHPHPIHTVGSSFSVRARTYIRVNGMGRDKAGEDFYFLHKCIHLRNFWEINDTSVYPSSRESDRVSFGTGASIQKQLLTEPELEVYCLESFAPLKVLFAKVGDFWHQMEGDGLREEDLNDISEGLAQFAGMKNGVARIRDMYRDSASEATFRDKFFAWFNGFMILRYLNEVHKTVYSKLPVVTEAARLAERLGIRTDESAKELLLSYREYEKGRGNRKII